MDRRHKWIIQAVLFVLVLGAGALVFAKPEWAPLISDAIGLLIIGSIAWRLARATRTGMARTDRRWKKILLAIWCAVVVLLFALNAIFTRAVGGDAMPGIVDNAWLIAIVGSIIVVVITEWNED